MKKWVPKSPLHACFNASFPHGVHKFISHLYLYHNQGAYLYARYLIAVLFHPSAIYSITMKVYEQITFDFNDAAPPKESQPLPQPQPAIGVRIKSLKQQPMFTEDTTQVPPTVAAPVDLVAETPVVSASEITEAIEENQAPLPESQPQPLEQLPVSEEIEPVAVESPTVIVEEKQEESAVVFETDNNTPEEQITTEEPATNTPTVSLPVLEEIEQEDVPTIAQAGRKSGRGRKSLKEMEASVDFVQIPPDEILFQKQYYSIGEVAEMFGVNQSLLRFWENEFDILQPRKNRKGDRHFRPIDIKNLELIYDLLRRRKLTIEGAKDFLRQNKMAKERFELIQSLQNIRGFLLEIKAKL